LSHALKINPHFDFLQAEVASRTLEEVSRAQNRELRARNAE
jgi:hypothetical protein